MRCPKCGYNSFDHLDNCKKCGKDLVAFKQTFAVKSVLFPGQMKPGGRAEEAEFDHVAADAAVSAATGIAIATVVAGSSADDKPAAAGTDSDDFGFDFMGDSAEDDDLSFDELFEDAPEDEDIEETIAEPKETAATVLDDVLGDDFSFDLPIEEAELEDDFGFDPADDASDSTDDEFSFDDEFDDSGIVEDPKRPFDLPESPQVVGAPVDSLNDSTGEFATPDNAGESGGAFVDRDNSATQDGESEGDVFKSDESVFPVPTPDEQSELIVAEAEVEASSLGAVVIPEVAAVPDSRSGNSVDSVTTSFPSLSNCIVAFVCDLIVLVLVGISFVVAAEAAMSTGKTGLLPSLTTLIDLSVPYFLVLFFLGFGYFTLFHFLVGQTPGKMLKKMRVETTAGDPLSFAQAFLRSVGGLLQLLPVGLGYLIILTSSERRGWNDRLAGTRVVALRDDPQ